MWSAIADGVGGMIATVVVGAVIMIAGAALERRWPATPQDNAGLRLNLAYFASASVLQALLRPLPALATAVAVRASGGGWIPLPDRGAGFIAGAAIYLVATDAGEYLFHRAQHAMPWLWSMHSLHHSDEAFGVSTTVRHFWLESSIKSCTIYLAVALMFRVPQNILQIYAIVSYYNYFSHANLRIGFGRWSFVVNSPQYHRLHHSRVVTERECNFAAILPIFDVLTGAYLRPQRDAFPPTGLWDGATALTLSDALTWPVRGVLHRTNAG